jgi:alpha-galactosidase
MTLRRTLLALALLAALPAAALPAAAQAQQLAATPPMGWNSWNHFAGRVTDADVRSAADALVSSGMRDAGYVYVNIDDTWEADRDAQGNIQTNKKFPDMKALADYVHSKGLKLGIYSSPGSKTCAHFEGSLHHEQQDANSYAAWGIDYLKYDLCDFRKDAMVGKSHDEAHKLMVDAYRTMFDALTTATAKTGRPIVYSLCQYGMDDVWTWGASVGGNLWRTTGDISDRYSSMANIGFNQFGLAPYAGPGHWNDPDMLEVGNGGMSADEYRTHMALWAILAAPLLAGNDLSKMTPETIAILTNRDVLAVNQDKLGKQGDRADADGFIEVWSRPLADGSKAIGIFNRSNAPAKAHPDFHKLGFAKVAKARDLWLGKDLGALDTTFAPTIPAHGVLFLKVTP